MKNLIVLKAQSNAQAQSKHLRTYEKINLSERGKPESGGYSNPMKRYREK